jgi:hypothetical protein
VHSVLAQDVLHENLRISYSAVVSGATMHYLFDADPNRFGDIEPLADMLLRTRWLFQFHGTKRDATAGSC